MQLQPGRFGSCGAHFQLEMVTRCCFGEIPTGAEALLALLPVCPGVTWCGLGGEENLLLLCWPQLKGDGSSQLRHVQGWHLRHVGVHPTGIVLRLLFPWVGQTCLRS